MCIAVNALELFCRAHLTNIERFLYHSNFNFKYQNVYMHVNSPASADENQLKCEKACFLTEMSEINSR